jgi:hypothetical protein
LIYGGAFINKNAVNELVINGSKIGVAMVLFVGVKGYILGKDAKVGSGLRFSYVLSTLATGA